MPEHKNLDSIHKAGIVSDTDPSANPFCRAEILWIDSSQKPYGLKIRNSANDGWIEIKTVIERKTTLSADQNNYSISGGAVVLANASGSLKTVTGITGGAANRQIELFNGSNESILLAGESSSSTAANRFANGFLLDPFSKLTLIYNGTSSRWEIYK